VPGATAAAAAAAAGADPTGVTGGVFVYGRERGVLLATTHIHGCDLVPFRNLSLFLSRLVLEA